MKKPKGHGTPSNCVKLPLIINTGSTTMYNYFIVLRKKNNESILRTNLGYEISAQQFIIPDYLSR